MAVRGKWGAGIIQDTVNLKLHWRFHCMFHFANPSSKPSTVNPKPQTLNPKPQTRGFGVQGFLGRQEAAANSSS